MISRTKMYLEQLSAVTVGQNIGFDENICFETRFNVKIQEKFVSKNSKSSVLPDFWINIDSCMVGKGIGFDYFKLENFQIFKNDVCLRKMIKGSKT